MVGGKTTIITVNDCDDYPQHQQQAKVVKPAKPDKSKTEAKVEGGSNGVDLQGFKAEMLGDEYWCEVMAMRYHLTLVKLHGLIGDFFTDQTCRGKLEHSNLRDAKAHFNNWLLLRQRIDQENRKKDDIKERRSLQRRGFEAGINEAEDYKTAF